MKILRVGDPHVQVSNLKDSESMLKFVYELAQEQKVERIEFLGDLHHNHSLVRVEVIDFWDRWLNKLAQKAHVVVLVGNHDMASDKALGEEINALSSLKNKFNISVIDKPSYIAPICYIPYIKKLDTYSDRSIECLKDGNSKTLVAHQTFTGVQYDEGFYAPDAVNPDQVPFENIISGHIHKSMQIGKCFYVGTPKYDSVVDANQDKGVWIYNHSADGSILDKKFYSTAQVVSPIYKFVLKEGDETEIKLDPKARNYIELVGSSAWIAKAKKKFLDKAQIKSTPTDRRASEFKVETNSSENLAGYMDNFNFIAGISKADVLGYINSL